MTTRTRGSILAASILAGGVLAAGILGVDARPSTPADESAVFAEGVDVTPTGTPDDRRLVDAEHR